MTEPYVFRTEPHLVEKVWGGRALETNWGKELPGEGPFGESWEVADLPEGQSRIANGALRGKTLREAALTWGSDLVGTKTTDGTFPLLVKILDARADLSVQVHPGPDDVADLAGARSKDEAWLILESNNGEILHGFVDGVDEARFREAVSDGRAEEALRRLTVSPGELYRVAPGTVHAICAGVQLLEIQQPSDTTYRVWDYDRPGLDGKPRPLHLEDALRVMKYEAVPVPTAQLGDEACRPLVETSHYSVSSWRLEPGEHSWRFEKKTPAVVFALDGAATIGGCELSRGQTAIIPASFDEVDVSGSGTVIVARA